MGEAFSLQNKVQFLEGFLKTTFGSAEYFSTGKSVGGYLIGRVEDTLGKGSKKVKVLEDYLEVYKTL